MEGHRVDSDRLPDEEFEYWLAATTFHMTPDEWDDCPAARCDWMVGINGVVEEVKAEAARKASKGAR